MRYFVFIIIVFFGCSATKEIKQDLKPEIKTEYVNKEVIKYVYIDTTNEIGYYDELNNLGEEISSLKEELMKCREVPKKIVIKRNRFDINSHNRRTNVTDLKQNFDSINNLNLNQNLETKLKSKEKTCSHFIFYVVIFSLVLIIMFMLFKKIKFLS